MDVPARYPVKRRIGALKGGAACQRDSGCRYDTLGGSGRCERIGDLWAENGGYHAAAGPADISPAERGAERYARAILDRLRDADARVLVAEMDIRSSATSNGVIADITTEMFMPLRCGLLADIYMQTAYRRRGLGKQLVERFDDLVFARRASVILNGRSAQAIREALAFWKALGGETTMLRMRAAIPEVD